ncbi:MAG: TolC family protein [Bacteroides sp.]|nr:TolC family protein [Bacteroides sp.]MBD5357543.1 TolC family protein [Bacteroides sp.]
MNRIAKLLVVASFAGVASSVSAEVWSLDSCVSYAIENNINIRQQDIRVREGELAITEAKDRFLPSADASASQSFNFGRGLTAENTYANRNTSNTQWGISVSLPLFQGMTEYHRLEIAKMSLQQYVFERESTKDNLTLNIISQYLQVLYNKEVAKSARSKAELSDFEVERQKALIEAGKVAEATLYDFQAVAAQDRLQVVTSDNDVQTALVNLANLLQLQSVEGFDIAPINDMEPLIPTPDAVYSSAMGINNGILGLRQAVKVADRNITLAKSGYIPTLSFNGGIGSSYYTVSGMPAESFGAQMRHNFSTYIGFSLRIPLFDAFNTRNGINRAKLQKLSAELTLDQQSADLYKEIQLAYYQALGARERYTTSIQTLENTRLSFDSTRERFNLGRATQADYEQAKNNLFKTELAHIQAHYEYILRTHILQFYRTNRL